MVERFVGEVASKILWWGIYKKSQLTHYDRDKGGHEAHDLEASINFYFSHFTQGTTFLLLWQSSLG